MRLTLVVCSFLFGLILAPIDGRLKYAEVLPSDSFESLLLSPSHPSVVSGAGVGRADGAVADQQFAAAVRNPDPLADEPEDKPIPSADGGSNTLLPVNCFPPADRQHKYDWARYYLRQLAAGLSRNGPLESTAMVEQFPRLGSTASKRSDFNREQSADLYAQYPTSCACQTKYELLDLGYTHFPRYIVNAICQNRSANSRKCWRGSSCKEIPYKVRVLTKRSDNESGEQDHHSTLLPEPLREYWRFKTVTIAAACQCSI
ncbi:uncharacterized protein LOC128729227 [Anopheles nili]|uniref:uncharacterized protein LOC128729227 n=1 Tax=Anopheles nili TaxID=185578 RepID=UPI00237B4323|nr:uncharacterized protein LOC128729227 [Anopheles nili]